MWRAISSPHMKSASQQTSQPNSNIVILYLHKLSNAIKFTEIEVYVTDVIYLLSELREL